MKIIECPRDAMQGIKEFIPTELKVKYINALLKVGFNTLDFGSFVSPKAIPQLADTNDVIEDIDLSLSNTQLLAICANKRGAEDIVKYEEIDYIGYPFSVSETFQMRNTNKNIKDSFDLVLEMQDIVIKNNKTLVVYLSMAFGNPYGDQWHPDIVTNWAELMVEEGIEIISLADTIGSSNPDNIKQLFSTIVPQFEDTEIGAHFHTTPESWEEKVKTAYENGCRRFDGALKGYGGCPMAKDDLTGNMPTENLLGFMDNRLIEHKLHIEHFEEAMEIANFIFNKYH
jgi:hydroxymethylglutaryl-CoA lyase